MTKLFLFAPALILLSWAGCLSLGVVDRDPVAPWILATAIATILSEWKRKKVMYGRGKENARI